MAVASVADVTSVPPTPIEMSPEVPAAIARIPSAPIPEVTIELVDEMMMLPSAPGAMPLLADMPWLKVPRVIIDPVLFTVVVPAAPLTASTPSALLPEVETLPDTVTVTSPVPGKPPRKLSA